MGAAVKMEPAEFGFWWLRWLRANAAMECQGSRCPLVAKIRKTTLFNVLLEARLNGRTTTLHQSYASLLLDGAPCEALP